MDTQSSTKTDIVAVDDCMPAVLWTIYWLNDQGYGVFENSVYQDNEISFVMENTGKYSRRNCTKHINIRYYFVTDIIEKYELSLEWCTKAYMIGYFMTKSAQGAAFNRFQDKFMVVTEVQDPNPGKPKILQISNK